MAVASKESAAATRVPSTKTESSSLKTLPPPARTVRNADHSKKPAFSAALRAIISTRSTRAS